MRRRAAVLLVATLAGTAGAALPLRAGSFEAVQKRAELRVLAVVSDPRDEFMTAQPGVGLERELLEGFAALHRLRLTVVPAPGWDRLVPMLLDRRADLAAGRITATEARRRSRCALRSTPTSRACAARRRGTGSS
jgi:ABC-type amino acid transport substrate-binding protein